MTVRSRINFIEQQEVNKTARPASEGQTTVIGHRGEHVLRFKVFKKSFIREAHKVIYTREGKRNTHVDNFIQFTQGTDEINNSCSKE